MPSVVIILPNPSLFLGFSYLTFFLVCVIYAQEIYHFPQSSFHSYYGYFETDPSSERTATSFSTGN